MKGPLVHGMKSFIMNHDSSHLSRRGRFTYFATKDSYIGTFFDNINVKEF